MRNFTNDVGVFVSCDKFTSVSNFRLFSFENYCGPYTIWQSNSLVHQKTPSLSDTFSYRISVFIELGITYSSYEHFSQTGNNPKFVLSLQFSWKSFSSTKPICLFFFSCFSFSLWLMLSKMITSSIVAQLPTPTPISGISLGTWIPVLRFPLPFHSQGTAALSHQVHHRLCIRQQEFSEATLPMSSISKAMIPILYFSISLLSHPQLIFLQLFLMYGLLGLHCYLISLLKTVATLLY